MCQIRVEHVGNSFQFQNLHATNGYNLILLYIPPSQIFKQYHYPNTEHISLEFRMYNIKKVQHGLETSKQIFIESIIFTHFYFHQ